MSQFTANDLAQWTNGQLLGDPNLPIDGVQGLKDAGPRDASFLRNPGDLSAAEQSQAGLVFVTEACKLQPTDQRAVVKVVNPDMACIQAAERFAPPVPGVAEGIHPTASIDPTATLAEKVCIGANVVVGAHAAIGQGCQLHPGAIVMAHARLGDGCEIWPNAVIRDRCLLGARCIVHPGAVIGADGFGYRPNPGDPTQPPIVKVPQIGNVEIGNDVEIGAQTCIDRATFGTTRIGDFVKIDNLVQIGHNVRIDQGAIICGGCGIAGSCHIGAFATIGGHCSMADHINIGAGAKLAGRSSIYGDIPAGGIYGGSPAMPIQDFRRHTAAMHKLPDMFRWWKKQQRATATKP